MLRNERLMSCFRERFGTEPEILARAPGRVNLIGEHTDYNEGFVLPCAIDRWMEIACSPVTGDTCTIVSLDYASEYSFDVAGISQPVATAWINYPLGVVKKFTESDHKIEPFNMVIAGNVPQGAGLSSSAAYEVAVASALNYLNNLKIPPRQLAILAQSAENDFVGVKCGIMDQFISALAESGSALLIDCRTLECRSVPLHFDREQLSVLVTHSGVSRELGDSAYNQRRAECEEGVALLARLTARQLRNLRDVSTDEFEQVQKSLPAQIQRRCRHVINENARVLLAVEALEGKAFHKFGKLLLESHCSLRDDFEVSTPELDLLVELSSKHAGVLGSRLTGAGFGGCTVTVMAADAKDEYIRDVIPEYERRTGRRASVYQCRVTGGAVAERVG